MHGPPIECDCSVGPREAQWQAWDVLERVRGAQGERPTRKEAMTFKRKR